jgi:uncharacterized protein (TIGR02265 family)
MSDIKGLMIHSRLDYVENLPDRQQYQRLLQHLGDSVRQSIGEQVFLTNSYPFSLLKELDTAIGEILNSTPESIFRDIGKRSANLVLYQYFFNYVQSQNPHGFLAQIEKLYPYMCNLGQYFYQKTDQKSARLKFIYDADIHKPYCWFIQEFMQTGIEICCGGKVTLKEIQCEADDGESCMYEVSWSE